MYVHSGRLVGPFVTRENRGLGVATPSAPLLACVGMMYLLWNAVLSLHQMYQDPCLPSSTYDSLVHRTLCQKALGSLMCFWQMCNGPLCSSWLAVVFALQLSHEYHIISSLSHDGIMNTDIN